MTADSAIDMLCINTMRTLAIDAVQQAKSGHAGAPMAMAPVAYTLWQRFLRYDPADPNWPNRDRFVLSAGHASMLLYAILHLAAVSSGDGSSQPSVTLDDLKHFRQLNSRTPGHPEFGSTPGVETTTGPLGQGCGNSVGMAMAGRWLSDRYNRPELTLFDYDVYALCSDGDLMEGVASEAASLSGHLELANLCWIYDNNTVTIEGHTPLAFSENVAMRFLGYGWKVHRVEDANNIAQIENALAAFKLETSAPTLIIVNSVIGYGAPHKQNTSAAHSDPLGEEEARLAKRFYGWPENAQFLVPEDVYEHFQEGVGRRGRELHKAWHALMRTFGERYPDQASQLDRLLSRKLPDGWDKDLPSFSPDAKGLATRDALSPRSGRVPDMVGRTRGRAR